MRFNPHSFGVQNLSTKLLRLRNRHFLLLDLLLFCLTPAIALMLRTESLDAVFAEMVGLTLYTGLALLVRLAILFKFGMYQRFWRYASSIELSQVVKALLVSTVLVVTLQFILNSLSATLYLPRSVSLIDSLLCLVLITGNRFSVRFIAQWRNQLFPNNPAANLVIIGAGHTGEMIAREIQQHPHLKLRPIAFLDDDPEKQKVSIHGIPVKGTHHDLATLINQQKVDRVIIAMPTASGKLVREIVELCQAAGVQTQTMPSLPELINGNITINQLRTIQIEDLLRRTPIQTDTAAITRQLRGKRVLITGGGGSIGSELCRQILRCMPSQLIVVGHGENSIFQIINELQQIYNELQQVHAHDGNSATLNCAIISVIADLRFPQRIKSIFDEYRPQVVFHAAAHKHVPLMEEHPSEAITNNVLGTQILLTAAQAANVERFVMISTDKAVNPTSIMGASKRTAEFLVHQAAQQSKKPYMVVRFGNVLGSRGSVVNTFKQQIAAGGPLTITHPEMVRYFMTIPEAVQLLLQASILGKGGEVFMLDMGQPVKIVDLAKDMITLSGLEVDKDIEIVFTGLRPGEKLYEEMFTPGETYKQTSHEKVLMAANASHFIPTDLNDIVNTLVASAWRSDNEAIVRSLQFLIPEFRATENGAAPKTSENNKPPAIQSRILKPVMGK